MIIGASVCLGHHWLCTLVTDGTACLSARQGTAFSGDDLFSQTDPIHDGMRRCTALQISHDVLAYDLCTGDFYKSSHSIDSPCTAEIFCIQPLLFKLTLVSMISFAQQWMKNQIGQSVLPLELIFFVTGRCNLRCRHCFIETYETDPAQDLPLSAVEKLADGLPRLLSLMLTGGEPFLRSDLLDIVRIFSEKTRPRAISITTNGLLFKRIIPTVKNILNLPQFNSSLLVTLSFEGLADVHDENRNFPGAYEQAMETARQLAIISGQDRRLAVGANLTLIPGQEKAVLGAAHFLAKTGIFSFLSQNLYRSGCPQKSVTFEELSTYEELSRLVIDYSRKTFVAMPLLLAQWLSFKERYQARLVAETSRTGHFQGIPCEAGRGIGVVYADGSVAPCELLPRDWGNITKEPFPLIWNRPENRRYSSELRRTKCFCTHECFLSASLNLQFQPMLSCLAWNLGQIWNSKSIFKRK
ncbi:MAG: radical SAM protein [Pseudomonadota bacterium]